MDHPPRESVLGRKVMRGLGDVRHQTSDVRYQTSDIWSLKSPSLKRASPHKYCGEAAATTLKFESRDE